jgi:hypothetical protein
MTTHARTLRTRFKALLTNARQFEFWGDIVLLPSLDKMATDVHSKLSWVVDERSNRTPLGVMEDLIHVSNFVHSLCTGAAGVGDLMEAYDAAILDLSNHLAGGFRGEAPVTFAVDKARKEVKKANKGIKRKKGTALTDAETRVREATAALSCLQQEVAAKQANKHWKHLRQ